MGKRTLHLFSLLCVLNILPAASGGSPPLSNTTVAREAVLVEYVGATGDPIQLSQVPVVEASVADYLVLSFAIDARPNGSRADGVFSPYWTGTLDPDSVRQFKAQNPNVKVLASLSGWSIYVNANRTVTLVWYDPENETEWIASAVSSLSNITHTYSLDGIDIDYESFPKATPNRFAYCIGTVIRQLKTDGVISIATIAPFRQTSQHYLPLFHQFGSYIDLVNYQFYTDRVSTPARFLSLYNSTGQIWGFQKLVASFAIKGPGVSGDDFFVAVQAIQKLLWEEHRLVGPSLMIWCVEDSVKFRFKYERQAQTFLKGLQSPNATTWL